MTFGLIMTATLLASLQPGTQQRQSDPEAQLQAAIHEEVVMGNPAGAIDQYKSIVVQNGVSRVVAATDIDDLPRIIHDGRGIISTRVVPNAA